MSFDHLRATYFEESAELLESAYGRLAMLAEDRADDDTVHALFRAIHSIKGGGGAFAFTRVVALAHAMETLLDPAAPRARIAEVARALAADGAEAIVLGCTGLAGHARAAEDAAGIPVIEPCQAAGAMAMLAAV